MSQNEITRTYHDELIEDCQRYTHVVGRSVLVVGCGKGKECELLRCAGAKEVVGMDCGDTIGQDYPHETIEYVKGFAEDLPFEDGRFSVVVSCATLEHVKDPEAALNEMIRVTAPRGVIYCYAAPLWNSPFGHHKKNIFPNDPWLHLRFDTAEKVTEYLGERTQEIVGGVSLAHHVKYMMDRKHFNKFSVKQFKEIMGKILSLDASPLHISAPVVYKHEELLTLELREELKHYEEAELFTNAIKLVLRKY